MFCIVSPYTDPYFNLAAEEYFFKNFGDDVFFLYINDFSVVVGKHQNALAEINPLFVSENRINVIRRMSGGGAVYHDKGNLNFSFHKTVDDTAKVSFREFNLPVVKLLQQMGLPAEISSRNDIVVNGFKVSGHAQHVFRNRVMSHGTLLVDSDLSKLSNALRSSEGRYESQAIRSIRSRVANVSGFISDPITAEGFRDQLISQILQTIPGIQKYQITKTELDAIGELAKQKYVTWLWNFGYSPSYRFLNQLTFSSGISLSCSLFVEKGFIKSVKIEGNGLTEKECLVIETGLINQSHYPDVFKNYFMNENNLPLSTETFLKLFF